MQRIAGGDLISFLGDDVTLSSFPGFKCSEVIE